MSLHLFYLGLLHANRSNLSIEHTLSFNGVLFFRCCLCINFTADMIEGEKQNDAFDGGELEAQF